MFHVKCDVLVMFAPASLEHQEKKRISESGGKSFGSPLLGVLNLLATCLIPWEVQAFWGININKYRSMKY